MWFKIGFVTVALLLLAFNSRHSKVAQQTKDFFRQSQIQINYFWQAKAKPILTKWTYRINAKTEPAQKKIQSLTESVTSPISDQFEDPIERQKKTHVLIDGRWYPKRPDHRYLVNGEVIYYREENPNSFLNPGSLFERAPSTKSKKESVKKQPLSSSSQPSNLHQDLQNLIKTSKERKSALDSSLQ